MRLSRRAVLASTLAAAAAAPARAQAGKTLVIGIAADQTGLDPEAILNNTSGFIMATILRQLGALPAWHGRGGAGAGGELGHLARRHAVHLPSASRRQLP